MSYLHEVAHENMPIPQWDQLKTGLDGDFRSGLKSAMRGWREICNLVRKDLSLRAALTVLYWLFECQICLFLYSRNPHSGNSGVLMGQ